MIEIAEEWSEFLRQYYKTQIDEIVFTYPAKRSLCVDYWDIDRYSEGLAEALLNRPEETLEEASRALKSFDGIEDKEVFLRIKNLTRVFKVKIQNLRSAHLNKFVAVEGLVKKVTEVRPILKKGFFQCQNCGNEVRIEQTSSKLESPGICEECSKKRFKFLPEKSEFSDTQKIEIQDVGDDISSEPARMSIYAEGDIAGDLNPGDRVITNGTLYGVARLDERRAKTTVFDKHVQANCFEMREEKLEEIEISEEDEKEILELSRNENLLEDIIASISPTIYGLENEKKALALQLFGGLQKEMDDGTRLRGDIHILFVGDPGTAKSQLLRYTSQLAPRGIYASGKSSSAAGLTATVVKDSFGEGRWSLEAGILVLADRGVACIDEIDKMTPQDSSAMHQAMEQQEVSIAKAGISATLQTRCAILGAANPKYGRFDSYKPIAEQINLSPALLSRFDLIFPFTDKPDPVKDRKLAEHIAHVHLFGEIKELRKTRVVRMDDVENVAKPIIEPLMLKKYSAYAKRRVIPILKEESIEKLINYYSELRKMGEEGGAIPVTARQFEATIRLAEASAKLRLGNYVESKDCDVAINIMKYCLGKIGVDFETGKLDIDFVIGRPASQRTKMTKIMDIIKDLERESEGGADEREVINNAQSDGIPEQMVFDTLRKLKNEGLIYEPRGGKVRIIRK